jgi:hypothetical protein
LVLGVSSLGGAAVRETSKASPYPVVT